MMEEKRNALLRQIEHGPRAGDPSGYSTTILDLDMTDFANNVQRNLKKIAEIENMYGLPKLAEQTVTVGFNDRNGYRTFDLPLGVCKKMVKNMPDNVIDQVDVERGGPNDGGRGARQHEELKQSLLAGIAKAEGANLSLIKS